MTLARGHFEQMLNEDGALRVRGWMFAPKAPLSELRALVDGAVCGTCTPHPREDVLDAHPTIPHARLCGFDFLLPDLPRTGRLEIEGRSDDTPIATLASDYRLDLDQVVPAPPPELLARTIATPSPDFYRADGLRASSEFKAAVARHRPLSSIHKMLDWGCGAGRNTVHFLLDPDVAEVYGCDIDRESVAWCREHLPAGTFEVVQPEPPMPFDDASFDLVIGCSVFTHLGERTQAQWLAELSRVLAPGGLLVASVHGDFAAGLHFRGLGRLRRGLEALRWRLRGFVDLGEDPRLDDAAPPGYYRAVFQSRRYTERTWNGPLEVIDYLPAGLQAHHDLVVLRRPA